MKVDWRLILLIATILLLVASYVLDRIADKR